MRTVGQLSRLTGMSRRTIQYYATEKAPGCGRGGAGVIAPCHVADNGYRYFDDGALHKLLAVKTLKQCGYGSQEIRGILGDQDLDATEVADLQIAALERAKGEIDRQIQFVNILKAAGSADRGSGRARMAHSVLLAKMIMLSVEQVVRKERPDFAFDLQDDVITTTMAEASDAYGLTHFRDIVGMVEDVGKGGLELAESRLAPEMADAIADEDKVPDNAFARCISSLATLYEEGADSKGHEARRRISDLVREVAPDASPEVLEAMRDCYKELLEGTYMAILFELAVGEGFVDYVVKALDTLCLGAKD